MVTAKQAHNTKNYPFRIINCIKVGFSPFNFFFSICVNDSLSKMMKNAFYFTFKALFVLRIFKFMS